MSYFSSPGSLLVHFLSCFSHWAEDCDFGQRLCWHMRRITLDWPISKVLAVPGTIVMVLKLCSQLVARIVVHLSFLCLYLNCEGLLLESSYCHQCSDFVSVVYFIFWACSVQNIGLSCPDCLCRLCWCGLRSAHAEYWRSGIFVSSHR